jgi:hypothetical protein
MKPPTLSIVFYLCLVFLSGVLVGSFGFGLYFHRSAQMRPSPEAMRQQYLDDMRTRLKLSKDQVDELIVILESTRARFHDLREKYRPDVKAIQDQQVQSIRAILSPEQQAEYEKLRQERERRHPPDRPPHPGPGPGR